jgi:ferredoxin
VTVLVRFRPFRPSEKPGKSVRVPIGTTQAGLPVASACGADGLCGRCGMRVLSGAEALAPEGESESRVKGANRVDPIERLACRVAPSGDVEVTARYW